MRVFVTGATGFIGSAVVEELLSANHRVIGLARSDAGARALSAAGAAVHRGSLEDHESLRRGAAEADGVIHLAFHHDFANFAASCALDQAAIEALGGALAGSGRPLVVSTGVIGLARDRTVTEDDVPDDRFPRRSEETAFEFADEGVVASVVRLPPTVHGDGDRGFLPTIIRAAREKGASPYVADGQNRWPAVHRLDAARLYRLALERGRSRGRYHAVAEEGIPIRAIAETIGKRLGVPAVSTPAEEVGTMLGLIGRLYAMDAPASSARTQEALGWRPAEPGLLADLEQGTYFDAAAAR